MEVKIVEFRSFLDVPKDFTGKCKIKDDGAICYYVNGKHHRLDGPTIELPGRVKYWYKDGKYHRLDGSALEHCSEKKYWYVEDKHWYVEGKEYTEKQFDALPEVIMYKAGLGVFI